MPEPEEKLYRVRLLKSGDSAGQMLSDEEASLTASRVVTAALLDPDVWSYAADLIETGEALKGTLSKNAQDEPVEIDDPAACGFCIMGAFTRAVFDLGYMTRPGYDPGLVWMWLIPPVTEACGLPNAANWWNNRFDVTTEQVVAALRRADPERIDLR